MILIDGNIFPISLCVEWNRHVQTFTNKNPKISSYHPTSNQWPIFALHWRQKKRKKKTPSQLQFYKQWKISFWTFYGQLISWGITSWYNYLRAEAPLLSQEAKCINFAIYSGYTISLTLITWMIPNSAPSGSTLLLHQHERTLFIQSFPSFLPLQ